MPSSAAWEMRKETSAHCRRQTQQRRYQLKRRQCIQEQMRRSTWVLYSDGRHGSLALQPLRAAEDDDDVRKFVCSCVRRPRVCQEDHQVRVQSRRKSANGSFEPSLMLHSINVWNCVADVGTSRFVLVYKRRQHRITPTSALSFIHSTAIALRHQ
jgi:hypothetical protein